MSYAMRSYSGLGGPLEDAQSAVCYGVSIDQWEKENQIPLFNEKTNVWVIQLQTPGTVLSNLDAEVTTQKLMEKWFAWTLQSGSKGTLDNLKATVIPGIPAVKPVATIDQTKNPKLTFEQLPAGQNPVTVQVTFDYRGSNTSMPWPRYRGSMLFPNCPIDTRSAPVAVFEPTGPSPTQDKCGLPDAAARFPMECGPGKYVLPTNWPWWAWVGVIGAVGFYTWPIIGPVITSAGKSIASRVASRRKK